MSREAVSLCKGVSCFGIFPLLEPFRPFLNPCWLNSLNQFLIEVLFTLCNVLVVCFNIFSEDWAAWFSVQFVFCMVHAVVSVLFWLISCRPISLLLQTPCLFTKSDTSLPGFDEAWSVLVVFVKGRTDHGSLGFFGLSDAIKSPSGCGCSKYWPSWRAHGLTQTQSLRHSGGREW